MERSRRDLKNQLARIAALIIVLTIPGYLAFNHFFATARHDDKETAASATKADVENFVADTMRMTPDLSVKQQHLPIIDRSERNEVLTYLVEAKLTNEYWFKVKDYRLDYAGDWTQFNHDKLADAIDQAYEKHTSFPQEVTASFNIGGSAGILSGGVTLTAPINMVAEALGFIRGIAKLDVDRVEVAIKGYADGQMAPGWRPPVPSLPPQFQRFQVVEPADKDEANPLFYGRIEQTREITYPYRNADLPDLRAQFIRVKFVDKVLPRLANGNRCRVYVLHNEPLHDANQAQWRKAQVYVMVYLKKTSEQGK